jgi:hypothetical protein
MLCAAAGRVDHIVDVARGLAARVAETGRAVELLDADDPWMRLRWRFAAVPCGTTRDGVIVVVTADPALARREAQAIATWIAPPVEEAELTVGGPCGDLARELARDLGADVVVFSLFAQAGMLLNMHVRSGALLRTWRAPVDTVWGEAARHGAAYVLGELHMHPGAESLASMGLQSAAVVGLENGNGVAIGSIGIASHGDLDTAIAQHLLEQAPVLGPRIMQLRSATVAPKADADGVVEMRAFAARVGCRRLALYSLQGEEISFVSAHAEDGSMLVSPPDPLEEQLVAWAVQRGTAVASEDAAVVLVGDDTILYAQDPKRRPLDRLRLALSDLRNDPYGRRAA